MSLAIAVLIAAAQQPSVAITKVPSAPAQTAGACPDVVTPDALICRALEAQKTGRSADSAQAFEQAALASPANEAVTARMWAAAGNMWLAASRSDKAAAALDRALSSAALTSHQRGEALLDRARAAEAVGDLKTARGRTDEAARLVADDPFQWYFSAALAIREGDKARAESAIAQALRLAPNDPTILFEAGHVARFAGDVVGARDYWTRAAAADPRGSVGKAAREALNLLPAPLTVKN